MTDRLPDSLSWETLSRLPLPDDLTVGEARAVMLAHARTILGPAMAKSVEALRLRFVWTATDADVPDDMTVAEFRVHARARRANLVIDDMSGGEPVDRPEPVA